MSNATLAQNQGERTAVYRPAVDVIESADAVLLVVDVPGVDEQEAEVTLEKNLLTIRGTVSPPSFEGYTLTHAEYGVGNFERMFTVSEQVDRERIEATVKDGVLTVVLKKLSPSVEAGRKITVKRG